MKRAYKNEKCSALFPDISHCPDTSQLPKPGFRLFSFQRTQFIFSYFPEALIFLVLFASRQKEHAKQMHQAPQFKHTNYQPPTPNPKPHCLPLPLRLKTSPVLLHSFPITFLLLLPYFVLTLFLFKFSLLFCLLGIHSAFVTEFFWFFSHQGKKNMRSKSS